MKLRKKLLGAAIAGTLVIMSPSAIQSASAFQTATPDSPTHFRTSALDSLADIQKDINDCRIALAKGGMFKLLANITTIEVHLEMLQSLVPQPSYAKAYKTKLAALDTAVSKFVSGTSSKASVSQSVVNLNALERTAQSLMSTVKSIK
jgi:hypothetical protein